MECKDFNEGITGGNLCNDLCKNNQLVLHDCQAHKNTTIVFFGAWNNKQVVFKTKEKPQNFIPLKDLIFNEFNENPTHVQNQGKYYKRFISHVFEHVINELSVEKLRETMTPHSTLELLWHPFTVGKLSWADMSALWRLIQRDEFIKLQLLQDMKHIPKVYGFCGSFYAMEQVTPLSDCGPSLLIKPIPWKKRVNISMDFLELSKEFSKSSLGHLYHCDVQPSNFGITKDEHIVATDIDHVFASKLIKNFLEEPTCESDSQCDFFDCKGLCNQSAHHCSRNILTNNLQEICKYIFVSSWIDPGLLQRAPVFAQNKLSSILNECASEKLLPWKHKKEARIYRQLKKILTELAEE
ncbi:divergent protein kinase domain 1C-like isoform X2 [Acropora palmata]|uniref:divergent protein kinase domain 1C-like isoform X2 n=1 Tax=Acropora palmata TaxID=6131 RepID=UPI003DA07223